MEDIIKQVVALLKNRENQFLTLTYQGDLRISRDKFVQAHHLKVVQVDLLGIIALDRLAADNLWVQSVLEGLSYGVAFELQLNCEANQLLPSDLVCNWPLVIYDKQGYRLRAFPTKAITYQHVAVLGASDKLLVRQGQLLSALAKETLLAKKIKCIERCC